jgi:endoglucanase
LKATADAAQVSIPAGGSATFGLVVTYTSTTRPVATVPQVAGQGCEAEAVTALYGDPQSRARAWVTANPSDGRTPVLTTAIADKPVARWFGDWSGDIKSAVSAHVEAAASASKRAVVVAYNIPGRDCGQYSAGGANSPTGYKEWIRAFAEGIGKRDAIVILEPDAIPQLDCLGATEQAGRLDMLNYATAQLKALAPNAWVYMDAGNSVWLTAATAASRLQQAGIVSARGFSLNVSNFRLDSEAVAYGKAVSDALYANSGLQRSFVVDTSRNGLGPLGSEWCDPAGRRLGVAPVINGTGAQPEMSLWIKAPGESDGCAGPAGTFVPDLAYKLVYGY